MTKAPKVTRCGVGTPQWSMGIDRSTDLERKSLGVSALCGKEGVQPLFFFVCGRATELQSSLVKENLKGGSAKAPFTWRPPSLTHVFS